MVGQSDVVYDKFVLGSVGKYQQQQELKQAGMTAADNVRLADTLYKDYQNLNWLTILHATTKGNEVIVIAIDSILSVIDGRYRALLRISRLATIDR